MCYHTHSSPNESIDFAVLWRTKSIDSFGKNGDIFSICTIYIFQTFFGTFPMTFLQKFSNQQVQFSIKINNIPKKPFEKSVRNISIHLETGSMEALLEAFLLHNWSIIEFRLRHPSRPILGRRFEDSCPTFTQVRAGRILPTACPQG